MALDSLQYRSLLDIIIFYAAGTEFLLTHKHTNHTTAYHLNNWKYRLRMWGQGGERAPPDMTDPHHPPILPRWRGVGPIFYNDVWIKLVLQSAGVRGDVY